MFVQECTGGSKSFRKYIVTMLLNLTVMAVTIWKYKHWITIYSINESVFCEII